MVSFPANFRAYRVMQQVKGTPQHSPGHSAFEHTVARRTRCILMPEEKTARQPVRHPTTTQCTVVL